MIRVATLGSLHLVLWTSSQFVLHAETNIFKQHFPRIRHQKKTARVQNIINFEARALMKIHSYY